MSLLLRFLRPFAVHGVVWRHYLDWAILNVPFYLHPVLIGISTVFFFFFAAPARRAVVTNLRYVLPGSTRAGNHFRAFRTLWNFAWTITEAATHRLRRVPFEYEIEGAEFLQQLATAKGAIVLTAHMGSYDLGAALFAEKFQREIRMVRAPERDQDSARHLTSSVQQAAGVKIDYNVDGTMLSFDLLGALRAGEIVSIQGDRVIAGLAEADGQLFGQPVRLPAGPFTLALIAQVPIYPLFIARTGFRRYRVVVREPITITRATRSRDEAIGTAVATWCSLLERVLAAHWPQWFAFAPPFIPDGNA
ncbi:MAG: lysophospholipid acyltransferase family protein [Verrucomicrobiota bacterium]|nr:lysophospholipid acyltransferase family protein [Verrucomicrobiota bacterium]